MHAIRTILLAAAVFVSTLGAAEAQKVYVPNYGDLTVSVLDAATLLPVATIPIVPTLGPDCLAEYRPDAVALTANRAFAFVTIDDCNQIAVIDTATDTVVKYITAMPGDQETRITLGPRGRHMYVTTCAFRHVTVIDVRTQAMAGTIEGFDGGTYSVAFDPNGRIGYAGNGYSGPNPVGCDDGPMGIYRIDLGTNTVLGFVPTARDVSGLAVSPVVPVALATHDRSPGPILVVNLTTSAVGAVMCGAVPCEYGGTLGVTFNATGTRAYAIDVDATELITIDTTDPLQPQEISRTPILSAGFAWQLKRSGGFLYVILADGPSEVVVFDIATDPDLPAQLPMVGFATTGFELDVWGGPTASGSETRGSKDKAHADHGKKKGHAKQDKHNNGRKRGHQIGHH